MGEVQRMMWHNMLQRSWEPQQWYDQDTPDDEVTEARKMWLYRKTDSGSWAVGFYTPDKEWITESSYETAQQAAARVHYLNGGD